MQDVSNISGVVIAEGLVSPCFAPAGVPAFHPLYIKLAWT